MTLRHELLERYGTRPVPRYTSYPPANHWQAQGGLAWAQEALASIQRPLSLYVHVPFCKSLCWYCGCNMVVEHRGTLVERYLRALEVELELMAASIPLGREVVQVHLGGGTPTHLSPPQLERLGRMLQARFPWAPEVEASLEVHPPVTTFEQLATLRGLGFNRISMGVQDFDEEVQARIHRPQPFAQTLALATEARRLGFTSVNLDLMYGLPLQSVERFGRTLDLVEELGPDRIALFGYAHMPRLKKHQALLKQEELPTPPQRLALLELAIERLEAAGYALVGLDHFARAHDELFKAQAQGTLRRNFMGYTTCKESEVVAFGPSSISEVRGTFLQNLHDVHDWCQALEGGRLAINRGWVPTRDDDIRRQLIMQLFCQLDVDTEAFGRALDIHFDSYFADEQERLAELERDGLVERSAGHLKVTRAGQLLLRNVASVFDSYLHRAGAPRPHAQAV